MSVLTQLALGISALASAGLTTLGTIIASSAWVVGSIIIPGNVFLLPDTNSTTLNHVYVGAQDTLTVANTGLGFVSNGSQSGVVLKDGTRTAVASYSVACTGTGGLSKYDTCYMPPILSSTGTIKAIYVMVSAAPTTATIGLDCSFVKARNTATGTVITNLNNIQTATGSIQSFSTGALLRWNSADAVKCGTIGTPTSSFAARLQVDYFDDTSE